MIFIGIDPGKDGAVAVILPPQTTVQLFDTPTLRVKEGSAKRNFDVAGMVALLLPFVDYHCLVSLERIHAMPGQGVTSMFSMGEGYGLWQGILAALTMPYQLVTPQRWKADLMEGAPKDKAASVLVASRLFPASANDLRGKKGAARDGRGDALLLAEWGRRTYQGPVEVRTGAECAGIPASE